MVPYRGAFSLGLTRGMMIFNLLLLGVHIAVVVLLAFLFVPSAELAETWAGAGESVFRVTVIPLVGLMAAYRGVSSKLRDPPPKLWGKIPVNSIEATLMIAVIALVYSIAVLFYYRMVSPTKPSKSYDVVIEESGLVAVGAAFAVVNLLAMFGAFIAISSAWNRARRWQPDEADNPVQGDGSRNEGQPDVHPTLARDLWIAGIGAMVLMAPWIIRRLVNSRHRTSGPSRIWLGRLVLVWLL